MNLVFLAKTSKLAADQGDLLLHGSCPFVVGGAMPISWNGPASIATPTSFILTVARHSESPGCASRTSGCEKSSPLAVAQNHLHADNALSGTATFTYWLVCSWNVD